MFLRVKHTQGCVIIALRLQGEKRVHSEQNLIILQCLCPFRQNIYLTIIIITFQHRVNLKADCCATLRLYSKLLCFIAIVAAGDRFTRFNTGQF